MSHDVTTSNYECEEFTASECSDSNVFYSDNGTERCESEESLTGEETEENKEFEARSL